MVPDGWKKMRVGDALKIDNTKRKPISAEERATMKGRYPYYGPTKVQDWINEYGYEGRYALIGEDGDHFLKYRTQGQTQIADGKFNVNNHAHALASSPNCSSDWFYFYFQNRSIEAFLTRQGAKRYKLNKASLELLPILVPPADEQQRIVGILSTWDRAIETTEKLIANSQAQKKALTQQLLTGKKRLPGFDGEWKSTKLGELGVISSAGVDKKTVEGEPPVRLLNFLDAYNREFIWSSDLTQEVTAPPNKVSQCDVRRGDVFFTPSSETRDDIGLAAVAAESMPSVVYSYHVVRLRPKLPLDLNFSAYVFQTDHFRRQTYRAGDGSGQRYVISQNLFRAMDVMLPPLEEQRAVGEILLSCSNQIAELQADLEALKVEKAALMQQLLTGKRRVKIEEAAA